MVGRTASTPTHTPSQTHSHATTQPRQQTAHHQQNQHPAQQVRSAADTHSSAAAALSPMSSLSKTLARTALVVPSHAETTPLRSSNLKKPAASSFGSKVKTNGSSAASAKSVRFGENKTLLYNNNDIITPSPSAPPSPSTDDEEQDSALSLGNITSRDEHDSENSNDNDNDNGELTNVALSLDCPDAISQFVSDTLHNNANGPNYLEILSILNPNTADASARKKDNEPAASSVPDSILTLWINALSDNVSQLSPQVSPLVDAILALEWYQKSDEFILSYKHLLENLVSAHAFYVQPVLKMLISSFRTSQQIPKRSSKKLSPPYQTQAALSTIYDHIHTLLSSILRLIPSGVTCILAIMTDYYPHKNEDVAAQVWYLKNLLRMVEYAPSLGDSVWAIAIDRAVQMDVEIQSALDDLDDEEYNDVMQYCFDPESENTVHPIQSLNNPSTDTPDGDLQFPSDIDSEEESEEDSDDESDIYSDTDSESSTILTPLITDFKAMAGKLDSILYLLITRLRTPSPNTPPPPLLRILDRTLLPTHKTRYTQYIYFATCATNPLLTDNLLVLLISKTFDAALPSAIRISSVSWLASFVARGLFVKRTSLMDIVRLLTGWVNAYVDMYERSLGHFRAGGEADLKSHGVFYSIVQSLLYLFCFRWEEMLGGSGDDDAGQVGMMTGRGLPAEMNGFQRVLMSRFAPLKICARSIVTEFARITHKLDLMYCYAFMNQPQPHQTYPQTHQTNAKKPGPNPTQSSHSSTKQLNHQLMLRHDMQQQSHIQQTLVTGTEQQDTGTTYAASHGTSSGYGGMEAFFPFDPCHLVMTARLVDPFYRVWKGGEDEEEEVLDGEDEDEDDGNGERGVGMMGRSFDDDIESVSSSFDTMMSISFER